MKKIFLSLSLGIFFATNFFGVFGSSILTEKIYAISCSEQTAEQKAAGLPCSENGIKTLEENQDSIDSGISKKSFRESVMDTLNYFLILLGILGVLVIIYSGVQAIVGGEEEVGNAKKRILGVIIGFVIIFLSYSVIDFISNIGTSNDKQAVETTSNNPSDYSSNDDKVLTDKNGNPILTPDGKPVYIDKNGNPYYIDENGNKVLTDKNGNPILTPDGKLIYLETSIKIFVDGEEVKSVLRVNVKDSGVKGILFDPSKSVLADGKKAVEYIWEFGDGNKDYYEDSEAVRQFYENAGNYILILSIKDNDSKIYKKRIRIIIKNLSADIQINPDDIYLGAKVSFDGSESKSSDGKISGYKWVIKGPDGQIIKKSERKGFTFIPKKAGYYKVGLTVKNLKGKEDYLEKDFFVNSNKPKSLFKFSNKSTSFPGVFIFDGGGSYDTDGDVLRYSWDFDGDGKYEVVRGDKFKVTYSYKEAGDYNVYLKVEDPYGQYDIFNQKVTVRSVLNVDFDVDRYASQKGGNINFTPKVPVGVNSIMWNFKDGKKETTSGTDKISHTFKESGIYTVKMTAINQDGEQNSIIKNIFIGDGEYPVGVFQTFVNGEKRFGKIDLCGEGKDGIEITRLDQIELNAKDSVNLDNTNGGLSYTWDFGDGEIAETQVARHKFKMIRDECYPVKIKVKDLDTKKVSKLSDTMRFKVVNKKPNIGHLQIIAQKNKDGEYVTPLKVKVNLKNVYDEDGNIVKYKWYYKKIFTNEKLGYTETFDKNAEFLIEADGVKGLTNDYVFVAEIEDNEGGKASTEDEDMGPSGLNRISVKNAETKSLNMDFEVNKTQLLVGEQAIFRVKNKKDNKNLIYSWDFNGDEKIDISTHDKIIEHTFDKKGIYVVELRVENHGVFERAYKTIYVDENLNQFGSGSVLDNVGTGKISGTLTGKIGKINDKLDPEKLLGTDLGIKLKGEGVALTSLNVRVEKYLGGIYKIIAHVTNSDASIYDGEVEFQIIKGKGEIEKPIVNAISSIAETKFIKLGEGLVEIKIVSKGTIYGDLNEKVLIY